MTTDRDRTDPRVARTRQRVLSAVVDVLREAGPEEVTHQTVAQRAGVGRATIYRHWPTPADLLFEGLDHYHDASIPRPVRTGDLRHDLVQLLSTTVRVLQEDPLAPTMLSVIDAAERDPEHARLLQRISESRTGPLSALIEEARSDGQLASDVDVPAAVAQLVGPLFFQRFLGRGVLDEDFVHDLVDTWLDGRRNR